MDIFFGFDTALQIWRAWSAANPISLNVFHHLRKGGTRLLPYRHLPSATTLPEDSAKREDIARLLAAAKKPFDPSDFAFPLHVIVRKGSGTRNCGLAIRHQHQPHWPQHSFLKIGPNMFASAPELVFVQMATALSTGQLIALGFELCGCYPLPENLSGALVRRPLSTPERLLRYAEGLQEVHGVKLARRAARYVLAKSASPMETELAAVVHLPVSWGGFGIENVLLNKPLALSPSAHKAAGLQHIVSDLYIPGVRIDIEYNGRESHASPSRQDRDSRRHDALALDGIDLVSFTHSQFRNITQTAELLNNARKRTGKRPCELRGAFLNRHMGLRTELSAFHRPRFP